MYMCVWLSEDWQERNLIFSAAFGIAGDELCFPIKCKLLTNPSILTLMYSYIYLLFALKLGQLKPILRSPEV